MIDHRHVIFVLAVVKVAKREVTAVRSLIEFICVPKGDIKAAKLQMLEENGKKNGEVMFSGEIYYY